MICSVAASRPCPQRPSVSWIIFRMFSFMFCKCVCVWRGREGAAVGDRPEPPVSRGSTAWLLAFFTLRVRDPSMAVKIDPVCLLSYYTASNGTSYFLTVCGKWNQNIILEEEVLWLKALCLSCAYGVSSASSWKRHLVKKKDHKCQGVTSKHFWQAQAAGVPICWFIPRPGQLEAGSGTPTRCTWAQPLACGRLA